jgi:hypothetical protein
VFRTAPRFFVCAVFAFFAGAYTVVAETQELRAGAFSVRHELVLPGTPEVIYDAITGDISGWWDHNFSGDPAKFYIEPKPGGCFCEIFDASGDGVKHAEVIVAQRGKLLRFDGPLGLSGKAIHLVHTYTFEPVGADSTRLEMSLHASGEYQEAWPATIDRVWHHFLFEQFKPYVEAGKHLETKE